MNIYDIVKTLIILFSIILLGYYVNKKKILDGESNIKLSELVIKVTTPALILSSISNKEDIIIGKSEVITILFLGILMYLLLIVLARVFMYLLGVESKYRGIYQLMLIFSNTGFIGYPLIRSIYGSSSIFPFSIIHIPFNILLFSYGVFLLKKGDTRGGFKIKEMINPAVISSILSLLIFLLDLKLPSFIIEISSIVGEATIPLSMLLIGSSLALIPIRSIFTDKKIYLLAIIKLIVLPLIIFYLSSLLIDNEIIIGFLTISVALPIGSSVSILSTQCGIKDNISSIGVFITTTLSIITIPIILYFLII